MSNFVIQNKLCKYCFEELLYKGEEPREACDVCSSNLTPPYVTDYVFSIIQSIKKITPTMTSVRWHWRLKFEGRNIVQSPEYVSQEFCVKALGRFRRAVGKCRVNLTVKR